MKKKKKMMVVRPLSLMEFKENARTMVKESIGMYVSSCMRILFLKIITILVLTLFASLHYIPNGRVIKIITDETNIQNAVAASSEKLKDCLIPVFKVAEVEISRDDDEELIVYAQQLSLLSEDYPMCSGDKGKDAGADHQHVSGVLLKIENRDGTFITTDLMETKSQE